MKIHFDLADARQINSTESVLSFDEPVFLLQEGVAGTIRVNSADVTSEVLLGAVLEIRLRGQ